MEFQTCDDEVVDSNHTIDWALYLEQDTLSSMLSTG